MKRSLTLLKCENLMKNLIIILLFLNPFLGFSQNLFTKEEILLVTEGGDRWFKDIKICLYGNYSKQDSLDVVENIEIFKPLIKPINISMVKNIDSANVVIYFLTDLEFGNKFKWTKEFVKLSIGQSFIEPINHSIKRVDIHIDIVENKEFKSFTGTISHEMFHMLGFYHYDKENNSILDHDHNLTEKDIQMIKYLYSETKE
jgi:hypothetical protein